MWRELGRAVRTAYAAFIIWTPRQVLHNQHLDIGSFGLFRKADGNGMAWIFPQSLN